MSDQLKRQLRANIGAVQAQTQQLKVSNYARENEILKRQMAQQGGSRGPANGKLPFWMAPGNVGDVNSVIWPFYFTTGFVSIAPNQNISSGFSVTQEAAFVIMEITKAVFVQTPSEVNAGNNYEYINPNAPADLGFAPGLSVSFQDSTSSRIFTDGTFNLDHIGNPWYPHKLSVPMMLIPRANFAVQFTNSGTDTFVPFLSFFGYRIRLEDSDKLLSLSTQKMG